MRRRLYNFFGLPELPEGGPIDAEIEPQTVVEKGEPIHIPKPVRKTVRNQSVN